MGLIAYESFIYSPGQELHTMEAAMEFGSVVRFDRYWLDRLSKLPAKVAGEISLYGFFISFNGVSRNHPCGNTAIRRAIGRPLSV